MDACHVKIRRVCIKIIVVSISLIGTPCDVCGPLAQGVAGIFHGATQQQERVFIMQRKALPLALLVLSEVFYWLYAATWTASLCCAGHGHGWVLC